jgi:hypothetical protein
MALPSRCKERVALGGAEFGKVLNLQIKAAVVE